MSKRLPRQEDQEGCLWDVFRQSSVRRVAQASEHTIAFGRTEVRYAEAIRFFVQRTNAEAIKLFAFAQLRLLL